MNDLISREAAIHEIARFDGYIDEDMIFRIQTGLSKIPSAQPANIQDILEYLDAVLHPVVSPEHWTIYSKLYDMISTTLSDVREVKHGQWEGKPIAGYSTVRCSSCREVYTENNGRWSYCPNCGAMMSDKGNRLSEDIIVVDHEDIDMTPQMVEI